MEILKKILGEEIYQGVVEPLEKDVKEKIAEEVGGKNIILADEGQYIPKAKFDEKNEENKAFRDKIAQLEDDLEKLSQKSAEGSSVEEELKNLKQELEEEREKRRRLIVKSEVQEAIKSRERKAHSVDDVFMYLGDEVYQLEKNDDGEYVGLEEKLNKLEEEKPHWFVDTKEKPKGTGGFLGNTGGSNKNKVNYGKRIGQAQRKEKVDTSAYEI